MYIQILFVFTCADKRQSDLPIDRSYPLSFRVEWLQGAFYTTASRREQKRTRDLSCGGLHPSRWTCDGLGGLGTIHKYDSGNFDVRVD